MHNDGVYGRLILMVTGSPQVGNERRGGQKRICGESSLSRSNQWCLERVSGAGALRTSYSYGGCHMGQ